MPNKTRQQAIDEIRRLTKQSFAFVKLGDDGKCQEIYMCNLHKESELEVFVNQAYEYKATSEALEAKKKAQDELALKTRELALEKWFERQYVISAYQLLCSHLLLGRVEYEAIDQLSDWLDSYLSGKDTALPNDDLVFMGYYNKVKGSL